LSAPIIIFVICWTLTTHGKYSVSGDEPHYLLASHSLWADGDLDLRNNYAHDDASRFGASGLQPEHHIRENRYGRFFPVHDIGLPVALLPIYIVSTGASDLASDSMLRAFRMSRGLFAYSLMSIVVIVLVTTAAAATRTVLVADGASEVTATLIVLTAWLSPPVLSNSFVIFPEVPALLVTTLTVHFGFVSSDRSLRARMFAVGLSLGLLPWFHRKFVVYGALLAVAALWERRREFAAIHRRDRVLLIVVFIAPQLALAAWTWYYWGNWAGPLALEGSLVSWNAFSRGWIGLLLDRESGLFAWAPVYTLVGGAAYLAGRKYILWLMPTAALYLLSAAHQQWWAGFSPAARFFLPIVPVLCLILSKGVSYRPFESACFALLVPQLLISMSVWQHTRELWPQGNGRNPTLGRLFGWAGGGDQLLPSLRTSSDWNSVLVWVVILIVANGLVVFASLRRRPRWRTHLDDA
jgi:hypothetical protein